MSRKSRNVVLKEKNPKQIRVVWILIALLVIVAIVIFARGQSRNPISEENIVNNKSEQKSSFTITQFSPQGHRQMMGYGIITKNKKVVIIDGGLGENKEELENYINKHGGKVDYWFLTHPHIDHVGAFVEIALEDKIKIDNIYCSMLGESWYSEKEEERKEEFEKFFRVLDSRGRIEPNINDIINIDEDCEVEILWTKNKDVDEEPFVNNQSMVFKIKGKEESVLILGDTGPKESEFLLYKYKGSGKLKATMVQVSHHGQRGATEELYQEIKPELAFWPTTNWLWLNDSGNGEDTGNYKTKETKKWLDKLNVKENVLAFEGEQELDVR